LKIKIYFQNPPLGIAGTLAFFHTPAGDTETVIEIRLDIYFWHERYIPGHSTQRFLSLH
jgi:hypothetical protein